MLYPGKEHKNLRGHANLKMRRIPGKDYGRNRENRPFSRSVVHLSMDYLALASSLGFDFNPTVFTAMTRYV